MLIINNHSSIILIACEYNYIYIYICIYTVAEEPMGHQGHVPPQKLQHADCAPPNFYTEVCNI